jgi:hypothetical protein
MQSFGDDPIGDFFRYADDEIRFSQEQSGDPIGQRFVRQLSESLGFQGEWAVDFQDEGDVELSSQVDTSWMPQAVTLVDEVWFFNDRFDP